MKIEKRNRLILRLICTVCTLCAVLSVRAETTSDRSVGPSLEPSVQPPFSVTPDRAAFYYTQAVRNYDKNLRRLENEGEPWDSFSVRIPADYLYALTAAEAFFAEHPSLRTNYTEGMAVPIQETVRITSLIRSMQELRPDVPFRGNFRWYWRQKTVEDRNAAEFVVQRLLFCHAHQECLPESCREPICEILRNAAEECVRRTVSAEYTNISVLNFSNLILLGEAFEKPEWQNEGRRRMQRFLLRTWRCGIREFGTPTYFTVVFESLEQLRNLTKDEEVRNLAQVLLEYWTKIVSIHLSPNGTFTGACSRSYNYLYGDPNLLRHVAVWGWFPLPETKSDILILAALAGRWNPGTDFNSGPNSTPYSNLDLISENRTIRERWGDGPNEWKTTFQTPDFAVGTSSAAYFSHQDQLWTVDWRIPKHENHEIKSNNESNTPQNVRTYFIVDGRGDPWGSVREPSGGGHMKAFHLDPEWSASQKGPHTACRAVFSEDFLSDFRKNHPNGTLQSVFVLKRPDAFRFAVQNQVPSLFLRYGNYTLILKIELAPHANVSNVLQNSPNGDAAAWCVTHSSDIPSEIRFTSNIVRNNSLSESTPSETLAAEFEENQEEISRSRVPDVSDVPPRDILEVDGEGVGRAFLEDRIPPLQLYAKRESDWQKEKPPTLSLETGESQCFSASSSLHFSGFEESDGSVRIQSETAWCVWVEKPGKYVLSAEILASDPQHDSLRLAYAASDVLSEFQTRGIFTPHEIFEHLSKEDSNTFFTCWALGSSSDCRTIEFHPSNETEKFSESVLELPSGPFLLILAPREFDVRVRKLILKRIE